MPSEWNPRRDVCGGVGSILFALQSLVGELPEGQTAEALEKTPLAMLDFAERLAGDDAYWEQVPSRTVPSPGEVATFRVNVPKIARQYGRPNLPQSVINQMVRKYAAGETREELRVKLRRFLSVVRITQPSS